MTQQATQPQMSKFVRVVDEFMQKYARLISPQTRAEVYASGNPTFISDYEKAVSRGGALRTSINATVGAWQTAKREWSQVTDVTSMYIGDAVDWLKNLFGGGPQIGGLGLVQIPAAAFVIGAIGASAALILSIDRIFITLEANRIQRDSPDTSRADAITIAKRGIGLNVFEGIGAPIMLAGVAVIAWLVFGQKR